MDDTLFFKIINEKHRDLIETAAKKKYSFMIPPSKYITHNMLTRQFYDNHIFYNCEYDEKMLINLNGKVIQSNNNQFHTFLSFKRPMIFNVLDEGMREVGNSCVKAVYIDNVLDESAYNQSTPSNNSNKRDNLKRLYSKEEYIQLLQNLMKKNEELRDIDNSLNELVEKLQNNYILIKNHVVTYAKYFQELSIDFRSIISNKLQKFKNDDTYNLIINEMTESLVFNKINQFLYDNIQQFNLDDEAELKNKIINVRSDFSFTHYKLDPAFNDCKFKTAISEFKKISNVNVPFEKLNILNQVNNLIEKESKETMEKNSFKKKNFQPTATELIPIWIYVLCNSDINNLLTECSILIDFRLKDLSLMSESEYNLTLFMNAIDSLKKEMGNNQKFSTITPYIIFSKTSMPDSGTENVQRSYSMSNTKPKLNEEKSADGLIGTMTSSFKGLFK